jgi:hypothetical protein
MKNPRNARRGQALLLVTLSLFAMCGLLGLAVDLGWSYYVKKSAQNAADSAALAAAYAALGAVGETAPFPSSYIQSLSSCPGAEALSNACLYAAQQPNPNEPSYGFTPGGDGGHQNVTLESGANSSPTDCAPTPTGPCVTADYWVTVRTAEVIPQLFSAVLGNTTGLSSARATAAAVQTIVNGSLITLNRRFDTSPAGTGIDVATQPVAAPLGTVAASDLAGAIPTSGMTGPIFARSPVANPGLPDGPLFLDPLRGYGQPPLPGPPFATHACNVGDSGPECIYAVAQGVLSSTICNVQGRSAVSFLGTRTANGNIVLPSGTYFPVSSLPPTCNTQVSPTQGGLSIGPGATVTFSANGGFGSFLLFGGLTVSGQMSMDPGEYVIVGGQSLQVSGSNAGMTSTSSGGAGQIIILTGSSSPFTSNSDGSAVITNLNSDLYPGLVNLINGPNNANPLLVTMAQSGWLTFGPANIQVGLGNGASASPSGLSPSALSSLGTPFPANLQPFGGIVLWQDQANSTVQYMPDGSVSLCGGINNACPKGPVAPAPTSPQLGLPGAALGLAGTIYQPRGAWVSVGTGAALTGSLQIITGAVAGGSITISSPPTIPLRRRIVALIE